MLKKKERKKLCERYYANAAYITYAIQAGKTNILWLPGGKDVSDLNAPSKTGMQERGVLRGLPYWHGAADANIQVEI